MSSSLCFLKMLAVCTAFKAYRRNSMLYRQEKYYILAKALNINVVTLKKYLNWAEELGILLVEGLHRRFIKLSLIFKTLFPDVKHGKYIRWFREFRKAPDYKYYYEQIQWAFARANFTQQIYHIKKNKEFLTTITSNRYLKRGEYKRLLKKHNVSSLKELLPCLEEGRKEIVTGKYHISRILGCSPSTGSNRLKGWDGIRYKRKISKATSSIPVSHASFDHLKALGYKYLYPKRDLSGFHLNLGSEIRLIKVNS